MIIDRKKEKELLYRVTFLKEVEYKKKDGTEVKGVEVSLFAPIIDADTERESELYGLCKSVWCSYAEVSGLIIGEIVRVKYGRYGAYIERVK